MTTAFKEPDVRAAGMADPAPMNGAESLARTLAAGGVDVCFANPGTSEMHFVAALDQVDGIRSVLCLFEGVATGAADGYARMTDKPAATLLHLGPGLANGLANLHNAKRARSPVVNIVGEHASFHRKFDAPLTSDIEALARPFSGWLRTSLDSGTVAADGADAIAAAMNPPGQISTLILPADTAWGQGGGIAPIPRSLQRAKVEEERIAAAAEVLRTGTKVLILLGDRSVRSDGLELASRIASATGADLLAETSNARMARGAGRPPVDRVPYPVDAALNALSGYEHLILVGSKPPVAFFGYPGKPSELHAAASSIQILAEAAHDQIDALARLADRVGVPSKTPTSAKIERPAIPSGVPLDPQSIARVVGALLPDNAIVCGRVGHDWSEFLLGIASRPAARLAATDGRLDRSWNTLGGRRRNCLSGAAGCCASG